MKNHQQPKSSLADFVKSLIQEKESLSNKISVLNEENTQLSNKLEKLTQHNDRPDVLAKVGIELLYNFDGLIQKDHHVYTLPNSTDLILSISEYDNSII